MGSEKQGIIVDYIRRDACERKHYPFVLRNVGVSLENADVFISNNHIREKTNMDLRWEIVCNVCLTMYPGLLLSTTIECCMQVAFIAKVNPGYESVFDYLQTKINVRSKQNERETI